MMPELRTLVCGCWLLPIVALGELNFQPVILDANYIAYERDVGDIDGDGDNDLVAIQEGDSTLQVFRAPNWTRSTLVTFTGTYRYPRADDLKLADLDGDGDLDIVTRLGNAPSSDAAGLAVWCENLGGGTNFTQHTIGNSLEYVKDIVVADFDRDHRLDVAMRMDSRTQLWLQEADGAWTEVLLTHPAHEGMEAGDLDLDGDPDLILNGFWFPTPNTPAAARVAANYTNQVIDAAWFNQTGDWTANSCKVVVGDFDGDGTNDVAFSQSERAGYAVAWYRSAAPNGPGPWTKQSVAVVDYCHNLQAADWDLDGDVDLLVGGMTQSQHRGLKLLLNTGAGTNWTQFTLQTDGSYSAEMGDIDNDGDLDIMGIRNWNSAPTYLYRNNSPSGVPTVARPVIAPNGGVFDEPLSVTLPCAAPEAQIRFTTNQVRLGTLAHWRLDERFGTVAADSSGHGHTGLVAGAVWTAGQRENALSFDGVDDRVECGTWGLAGTAMTVCAWVKLDAAFVDNDARILSKAVGPQEQDHWLMLSTSTSGSERRLRGRLKAGGSTTTLVAASGNLALNTWHHVAASYDGATLNLFLNGVEVGRATKSGAIDANPAAAIWIGANPPTAYAPFRGLIDDVRIYDTALDAAGVRAVMDDTSRNGTPRAMRLEPTPNGAWSLFAEGSPGH